MFSRAAIVLTLLSWLAVAPQLYQKGTNVVTQTYEGGAELFRAGESPYAFHPRKGDVYKYSPAFAAAYTLLARLPSGMQAVLWALINCLAFWAGVCRWFQFRRQSSVWLWIALAFCAMELDISLRYQQINALLCGIVLWALAEFRDRKYFSAGTWIAIGTCFKVLPGLFAAGLLIPWNRRYTQALVATGIALLLLPAVRLGFLGNIEAHRQWLEILRGDLLGGQMLDIGSVIARFGAPLLGTVIRWSMFLISIVLFFRLRLIANPPWSIWFTLGMTCLLLFSPKTEAPTFVLMAPGYLFLVWPLLTLPRVTRRAGFAIWVLSAFLITVSFTDLWPKAVWDPRSLAYATKTLGVFLFWGLTVALIPKAVRDVPLRYSFPS